MKARFAIETDLFAADAHRRKIDGLGDPLAKIESCIDFAALAAEGDRVAPRPVSPKGGRPPFSTETMVRIQLLAKGFIAREKDTEAIWTQKHGKNYSSASSSRSTMSVSSTR